MEKKDIYEHLANIYLDSAQKRVHVTEETAPDTNRFKAFFFVAVTVILCLTLTIVVLMSNKQHTTARVAMVVYPDLLKINYRFDPSKKEIYALELNRLNLAAYKAISFSARTGSRQNNIALKIEFTNTFNETAAYYVRAIPRAWSEYSINFTDFKGIGDWSDMKQLIFTIEEWNAKQKQDTLYIENIKFLK